MNFISKFIFFLLLLTLSCKKNLPENLLIEYHDDCSVNIKYSGKTIIKNAFAEVLLDESGIQNAITASGKCSIEKNSQDPDLKANLGDAEGTEIVWQNENIRIRWGWASYKNLRQVTARLKLENTGITPLKVLRLTPLIAESANGGGLILGKSPKEHRVIENGSDIVFDFVTRLRTGDVARNPLADIMRIPVRGNSISNWNTAVLDLESNKGFIAGYLTFEKCIPTIGLRPENDFFSIYAENILLFNGKTIQPGASILSEFLYIDVPDSSLQQGLEDYADAIRQHLGIRTWRGRGKRVPDGWNSWTGSSSTGGYGTDINQDIISQNLDVMKREFKNFGMQYFQMDDGYQINQGDWDVNLSRFPAGLEGYVQSTKSSGLKPGIWIAPFAIDTWSNIANQHPDWIAEPIDDPMAKILLGDATTLDLSNPEVITHLEVIIRKYADLGMEWLKTDFAYLALGGAPKGNQNLTAVEAYREAYKAIRRGLGEEPFLLGVALPLTHAGIADGIRITLDNAPRWDEKDPENLLMSPENSFKNVVRTASKRYFLHNRVFVNHNDLIFFRSHSDPKVPRLSFEESRTFCSFIALTGSIVKLGDKLVDLKEDAIQTIRKLLPVFGESARPLDLFTRQYPEIWSLHIDNGFYSENLDYHILGITNWGKNYDFGVTPPVEMPDESRTYTIKISELGLDSSKTYLAREFWTGNFPGEIRNEFTLDVSARDSALIVLREKKNIPQFLGHNRHWTQGATDMISEEYDSALRALNLRFKLDSAPQDGVPFEYIFDVYVPDGYSMKYAVIEGIETHTVNFYQNEHTLRITLTPDESGEIRISVYF